jgi:hypothetical protein
MVHYGAFVIGVNADLCGHPAGIVRLFCGSSRRIPAQVPDKGRRKNSLPCFFRVSLAKKGVLSLIGFFREKSCLFLV